jgi:hypothetical protein
VGFGAENFLAKEFIIRNQTITPTIIQNSTNALRNMNFKVNFSYRIGKLSMDQGGPRRRKAVNNDDLKGGGDENNSMQNRPN